jgi:arylsulfatase A-like enzyme
MLWLALLLACNDDAAPSQPVDLSDTAVRSDYVSPLQRAEGPYRNVLMISIDTLRRDHLGVYGGPVPTPTLDRLVQEGVALDDHAQCSSWTFHSTTCTLSGRYPEDLGYLPRLTQDQAEVPEGTEFLATWLSQAGFTTVVQSPNAWLSERWGNTQGHDLVLDRATSALSAGRAAWGDLQALSPDRWYLHVHVTEPHAPYSPPDAYLEGLDELEPIDFDLSDRGVHYEVNGNDQWEGLSDEDKALVEQHLRVRYAGDVAWLDTQLGTWLDELDAAGALDDTLVVVWSDHGEAFFEHGHQTHAWLLYPEENDGIAIFWAKGMEPLRFTEPTSAVDLAPSILDALELPIPDGLSGAPLGAALPSRARYGAVDARFGMVQSVRKDGWLLHYTWKDGRLSLYDLANDPAATTDLYLMENSRVQVLWPLLERRIEVLAPLSGSAPVMPW